MLNRIEAICSLADGETLKSAYRSIILERWCDERNDSREVHRLYQRFDETPPTTIVFDGFTYREGQCSGPSRLWVTYDRIEGLEE